MTEIYYEEPSLTTAYNPADHGYVLKWEKEKRMSADLKRAVAWGAGLGLGFALAGMALGVFRKVR